MNITLPQILSVFATLKTNQNAQTDLTFFSLKPKHLKLLEGLALLAVTEGSHDVAAVTMINKAEGNRTISQFYFTKNRDFSTDEVDYLNTLCGLLNSCPPHLLSSSLQDLILRRCRPKIISRLVKLQQTVKELEDSIPSWDQPSQEDVDKFSRVYPTAPGMTWAQILWSFLSHGLELDQFASSNRPKPLFQSLLFFKRGFSSYLRSPQLTRRLRKVSAYAAIITRITKMAVQERTRRTFQVNLVSH